MASTTKNTLGISLYIFLQTLIQTKDFILDSALNILLVIHHQWISFTRQIQTDFTVNKSSVTYTNSTTTWQLN